MNVKRGTIDRVATALAKIDEISEYAAVSGRYDFIVKVEGENIEDLLRTVIKRLHKIEGVQKTETLIEAEVEVAT